MFDISFSELMLIGVIALIVIGPEKLPKVARTVGHLLGRAQRYVNDVKTDIRKEMDAADIGNLKEQMQEAAQSVKASVDDASKSFRAPLDEAQDALKQASESVRTLAESASKLHDETGQRDEAEPPASDSLSPQDASPMTTPTASDHVGPAHAPEQTPDQDLQESEFVDTKTLPLPGFEREPVTQSDSTSSANSKGDRT